MPIRNAILWYVYASASLYNSVLLSICTKSVATMWERKWRNDPHLKPNSIIHIWIWLNGIHRCIYLFVGDVSCANRFMLSCTFLFPLRKLVYKIFSIARCVRFRLHFHMSLIHFKNELSIRFFVSVAFPKCSAYFSAIYDKHVEKSSLAKSDDERNYKKEKIGKKKKRCKKEAPTEYELYPYICSCI